jgi:hypothetical protein
MPVGVVLPANRLVRTSVLVSCHKCTVESFQILAIYAAVNNAQWLSIRAVLMQALAPFPDARAAVASALEAQDAG